MNFFAPPEVAESAVLAGKKKAENTVTNLVVLGILAGAFIALAGHFSLSVTHDMKDLFGFGFTKLIGGLTFSVGLMMVILAGAELFTGNILIIVAVLSQKVSLRKMLRNWAWVYAANFAGALLVVYLVTAGGLWQLNSGLLGAAVLKTALAKVGFSFNQAFALGILCNWLVCLAVWISWAAKDVGGKILGIFFVISAFVASSFEHSVANMYYIPAGLVVKGNPAIVQAAGLTAETLQKLTWSSFIVRNLIPVTLGNIVGGVLFVGLAYWLVFLRDHKNVEHMGKVQPIDFPR